jgi:hypothetical protein
VLISFTISLLQHIINPGFRFLRVPSVTRPLIFLVVVVLVTAKLTGGIAIKSFGSESVYGGKRYFMILMSILGYFAITARQIPPHRVALYVTLFFLGSATLAVGNLAGIISPSLNFIFLLFPVETEGYAAITNDIRIATGFFSRMGGLPFMAIGVFCAMLARYGIRGILNPRRPVRLITFITFIVIGMFGGYRSMVIIFALTFAIQFYFEGLFRTRLFPLLSIIGLLGIASLPLTISHMPLQFQRALSFLPFDIDPIAKSDAEASTEWRVKMWKDVLPQVPRYLIIGKGYSINANELAMAGLGAMRDNQAEGSELAGDYHNGPLSVIVPFGIFGVFGFLWFLFASGRVLYQNYVFGNPVFRRVNTFLFAYFLCKAIFFFAVFGSLYSDLATFIGLVALSVSINGGAAKPAVAPRPKVVFNRFKLHPSARPATGGAIGP